MLFAVAITSIGETVSEIHVRKCPNMDEVVPASVSPDDFEPAKTFSISSIQITALPKASIIRVASLMRLSDSPTSECFSAPMSRRISGHSSIEAVAFDDRLFPVPGMPTRSMPFSLEV